MLSVSSGLQYPPHMQSTLEYHGCNCCSDARAFSMDLATKKEETPLGAILELSIRIRYVPCCKIISHSTFHVQSGFLSHDPGTESSQKSDLSFLSSSIQGRFLSMLPAHLILMYNSGQVKGTDSMENCL